MPATVTFDTHKFVKTLRTKGGFTEAQAEGIFTAVSESHESADFAMKQDIADLRRDMADLRKDMKEMTLRLIIWLGGLVFVAVNTGPILPKLLHLFL